MGERNQKLYTRCLDFDEVVTAANAIAARIVASLTAEMDMYVRKIELEVVIGSWTTLLAVAGLEGLSCRSEITQAGMYRAVGSLLHVHACYFNSVQGAITPNAVKVAYEQRGDVDFGNHYILVKEEGVLNLIHQVNNVGGCNISCGSKANIFFTLAP